MGDIATTDDALLLSISKISRLTGKARETVAKLVADSGLPSTAVRNGYPVYLAKDVLPVIYPSPGVGGMGVYDSNFDPRYLPPKERRDYYASEKDRITVEEKQKNLIPKEEYRADLARVLKTVVSFFETLPDVLERDCGLDGQAIDRLIESIDQQRDELSARLMEIEP